MTNLIKHKDKYYIQSNDGYNEVLATTDSSLKIKKFESGVFSNLEYNLYQPSPQFIQAYIEAYNASNPIVDVMVEYEEDEPADGYKYETIKIDKNNYITITKCKDSWSREEVVALLSDLNIDINRTSGGLAFGEAGLYRWINQHL